MYLFDQLKKCTDVNSAVCNPHKEKNQQFGWQYHSQPNDFFPYTVHQNGKTNPKHKKVCYKLNYSDLFISITLAALSCQRDANNIIWPKFIGSLVDMLVLLFS